VLLASPRRSFIRFARYNVITRLNDRIPCTRPNGLDILFASNFPFGLHAFAFSASGLRNAKSAVHAQRQAGARWSIDEVEHHYLDLIFRAYVSLCHVYSILLRRTA
jgi:hypothetical protein